MDRRAFLMTPGLFTAAQASGWQGANDRIQLGVVGVRGRGRDHIAGFVKSPNTVVAAVCDVDQTNVERAQSHAQKLGGRAPAGFADFRKLLEDKSILAVSLATPNHWHALGAVWAVQAGKDVYAEKPVSHNLREGRVLVEAARKYKRIVQVGHQSRSTPHKIEALRLLREGIIGRVYLAKGYCYKRRMSIGHSPDGPVPAGVDYDKWLGPAPVRPFNPNRFHYNWHWFWDYGNGDIGNQGVHEMDICRWGLNQNGLPRRVTSHGGKFVYQDDQETPNMQTAVFDYGGQQIHFEVRGLISHEDGALGFDGTNTIGNTFYGADGYMSVDAFGYKVFAGEKHELVKEVKLAQGIWDTQPHFDNFTQAVRSRRVEDLTCDVEQGHLSAALCHLANVSYRTGRSLRFDPAKEAIPGDAEANKLLTREYRAGYVLPDPA